MERGERSNQFVFPANLLALCAVSAVLIGGGFVRHFLPAVPLADGDTWGYLRPALSWLSGLGFVQVNGRDWLYPALLAGILKVGGDFSAITYVQHFLGLAGILLFWLAWRSWSQLMPAQKPVSRWGCFILSLSLLVLYALSPQQALLEDTIRPEGMLAFFEMAYLYCLVSFFAERWRLHRTAPAIIFGAASLGLSYMVLLLKPSWGFAFGFSLLCVAAGIFGRATSLMRFGPLVAGAIAIALLLSLPKLLGFQKDDASQLFLPFTLVSIHAPQILEAGPGQFSPNTSNSDAANSVFYRELAKAFRAAKENPAHYDTLGFDTDYILYRSGFFSTIGREERGDVRELAATCYSAYFHAWLRAPWSMLQKVWKQISVFLFPRGGDFYSTAKSVDLNREIAASRPFLSDTSLSPLIQNIYQSYRERLEKSVSNLSHPLGFPILTKLAYYLAKISFWIQLAFFSAMVAVCLSRRRRAWQLAGFVIVAVLAATYGNVLTIAVVHSLDVFRYRVSYAPGFLLGLAMIANYLLVLALGWRDGSEPRRDSVAAEVNSQPASGRQ